MANLPTGTITFLFTDIEGSTVLLQRLGDHRYAEILEEHRQLLRAAFEEGKGQEVGRHGDALLVAFSRAREAVAAAVAAQRSLATHPWPEGASLRVRMGLHTGEPVGDTSDYVGLDVHRASRICSVGHGGQILVSQAVEVLVAPEPPPGVSLRDIGTHRLKDLTNPEHLFQVVHSDLPADFPPLKSLDARPNNLPIQLTKFVGRVREMAEVKRLLGVARLITLTGPGGTGKTRLALQMVADIGEAYPDGVWLAEFAPITDPILVPETVASALNLLEQPGRDMTETLVDALRSKTLLFVLDNCEHLLAACRALAATLLRTCPQLCILATSREKLGVPGEILWPVPSLSLPEDTGPIPSPEELVRYDAVRLFVDRAVTTTPGFTVTKENAPAVAQVCRRLDGLPLAIELAAARLKILTVEQIALRLDDRFRLLSGGSPIVLHRQQTLRATIDWSYQLLSDTERLLLRRLSVFAGGWTVEAAEAVCAGNEVQASDILDLLTNLADKSLILTETYGREARYHLLETVRQYALERLLEAGEAAEVRKRHRDWYLAWMEALDSTAIPTAANVIERWELDHDNLRAALAWSKATDDGAEAELRLAGALRAFWFESGHWHEGRRWLEDSLARNSQAPPTALLKALEGAMHFAWRQGDNERATSLGERGLALSAEAGDGRSSVGFLHGLSTVALHQGDYDRASTLAEEGLERARRLNDKPLIAQFLSNRGVSAIITWDYDRAAASFDEGLTVSREAANAGGALRLYQHENARTFWLRGHGLIALRRHDDERAEALYREGLALSKTFGKGRHWMGEECLEGLAGAATGQGDFVRGARLFAAAETLRETLGRVRLPPFQADHEQRVASTRAALGEAAFAAAWVEGRAMTLEQAIEYALAPEGQIDGKAPTVER